MTKRSNIWFICTILALEAGFEAGCATTHQTTSTWFSSTGLIIDGSDADWPTPPQYFDKTEQVGIRFINDRKSIYLCFSAGTPKLKQKLMMTGLTLWLDPEGGKNKVFGVHISDRKRPRGPFAPGLTKPDTGRIDRNGVPHFDSPDKLDITYPHTTGPLAMTIAEARNAGIEAAAGMASDGKEIVEYKIRFDADEVLSSLRPGMNVGVGFETGKMKMPGRMGPPNMGSGMGMPEPFSPGPPDGGMGPGMEGAPAGDRPLEMKKEKSYEVWIKAKLADAFEAK